MKTPAGALRFILPHCILGKMNALVINCSPVKNGATAELVRMVASELKKRYAVTEICIGDYTIGFCRGCRACHQTGRCDNFNDDFDQVVAEFDAADVIVSCSPSYWADVPGQYKAFIDRWTPWCNTHEPHAALRPHKKGYSLVIRTGPHIKECERLIQTIEHFYGHLEIDSVGRMGFTQVEHTEDVRAHADEIIRFCSTI